MPNDVNLKNQPNHYLLFTSLGLGHNESIKVAEVYLQTGDWDVTRKLVVENKLLQSRTSSRDQRVVQEVVKRLSLLSKQQLEYLVETSLEEQRLFMWFVVCNKYLFIREFAMEVLHQKFLSMEMQLTEMDFRAFYLRKIDWHPELEKITENTRTKLRTQLFRMLREASIISNDSQILRVLPTNRLAQVLKPQAEWAYQIFPAFPGEFEG